MADISATQALLVFAGGGVGSVLRFFITKLSAHHFGAYPYGTLIANLFGALIAGVAAVLIYERQIIRPPWNDFILAGFLGGLTTFSAMVLDTHRLVLHGLTLAAVVYVILNIALGLGLFSLAHAVARAT